MQLVLAVAASSSGATVLQPEPEEDASIEGDLSPPLRDIAPQAPPNLERMTPALLLLQRGVSTAAFESDLDPLLQFNARSTALAPPLISFDGLGNVSGAIPPDPNGDVGPNHYVQWVNLAFAIWDKAGTLLYGPAAGNTLWTGFGGVCGRRNDGDPIVLYDHLADRWVMSQFAIDFPNRFRQCIAVSQTPDPTGRWYRYSFRINDEKMHDYPKLAVWPDAYYMAVNQFDNYIGFFAGQGVVAFERNRMLAGERARKVYFDLEYTAGQVRGLLPSDLDGPPPPAGSPNYFVRIDDNQYGAPFDMLEIWQFHVDWAHPALSTFSGPQQINLTAAGQSFDSNLCERRSCIPQPMGAPLLTPLSDRLMHRAQYRNFGTHETLVLNHTVDVDRTDHAGIRWYELRNPGGTPPSVYQAGTYAGDPLDGEHRWMGSAAMNGSGAIALGYALSSATTYPSIRYVARLANDPLNTMPQAEAQLIAGSGAQLAKDWAGRGRWGDYSMLAVDPRDDDTFWYTQEYYETTSLGGWRTRIGAFQVQGSAGRVGFDHAAYSCVSPVGVWVSDRDLLQSGTTTVTLTGESGDSEALVLAESTGTGTFGATIMTSAAPSTSDNGMLEVGDAQTITAIYEDADDGSGHAAIAEAHAIIDCVPANISSVSAADVTSRTATIHLQTDEPSNIKVRYGTACTALTQTLADTATANAHTLALSRLSPATQYFFVVDATDAVGNLSTDSNGGNCYSFTTPARTDYFTEFFDGDVDLAYQTLTFTPAGSRDYYRACRNAATAFPTDPSGGTQLFVSGTSNRITLADGARVSLYGLSSAVFSVSPYGYVSFDSTTYYSNPEAYFSHPWAAALFRSFKFGSGSVSWKQLADRVAVTYEGLGLWDKPGSNSFQIELFFDGTIRITYLEMAATDGVAGLSRGAGKPPNFEESNLSAYGPCPVLGLGRAAYVCGSSVAATVEDDDLTGSGTVAVVASSTSGDSETMTLIETPSASGIFRGAIPTSVDTVSIENGTLETGDGETVTVTYMDADDGSGHPATRQEGAVIDCTRPAITNVAASDVSYSQATLHFETNEVTSGLMRYGTSCAALWGTATIAGVELMHAKTLTLSAGTQYFFTVEATDLAGNTTTDDNHGNCYSFRTAVRRDYFTQGFYGGTAGYLDHRMFTFTPDGSINYYRACRSAVAEFPTDPSDGMPLTLEDDDFAQISLAGDARVSLYGVRYDSLYVGSNGYVTFGVGNGDRQYQPSSATHFLVPRISALFEDLVPQRGGHVSWKQLADRVAITYRDVPAYGERRGNSFQIEMFFDGAIRITYLAVATSGSPVAGLSAGGGTPSDYGWTNWSTIPACNPTIIPGGGLAANDCTHAWHLEAVSLPTVRRVTCIDTDPQCDVGMLGQDDACTFRVGMCFNMSTVSSACTPSDVRVVELRQPPLVPRRAADAKNRAALEATLVTLGAQVQGVCTNTGPRHQQSCMANVDCDSVSGGKDGRCRRIAVFHPPLSSRDACTDFAVVTVPLEGRRSASRRLQLWAQPSPDPVSRRGSRRDVDTLTLTCKQSPY